ncbi:MAG TPA: hypothetical protein VGB64_10505 [Actinomycetota bacterium]
METTFYPHETLELPERRTMSPLAWSVVMLFGALFLGNQVVSGGSLLRVVAALSMVFIFAVPAVSNPKRAMAMMFGFLPFLGVFRRALVPATGFSALDPLLLVSSAVIFVILVTLIIGGKANLGGTVLARMVFWLLLIGLLQVFNPAQGNLMVGLTGVMFVLVPMMCFFIGRSIADREMVAKMQRWMIFVGVVAGAYGLYQVLVGFPGFEQAYLARAGFGGLYVGSAIRPFATFVNPLEYATYLNFAVMTALAYLVYRKGIQRYWIYGALAFMIYAGYLIGSRGFIVLAAVGAIALIGMRARRAIVALSLIGLMIGSILFFTSTRDGGEIRADETATAAEQLKERQRVALLDPLDERRSTLKQHYRGMKDGLIFALTQQPFGLGTGATGRGSQKFGDGRSSSTELDLSDATIAFGVVGGALYLMIIPLALLQLIRMRNWLPGPMFPAILGMGLVSFGQWLNGGNYAVAPLIWFMMGFADNFYMRARDARARGENPEDVVDAAAALPV